MARLLGGLSAGMAYPTTLALITALWSGPARTGRSRCGRRSAAPSRRSARCVAGVLLEHFWWGSVFLITLPLAVVALVMAWLFVPAHVNESTEPVDNLGGILSVVLVAGLVLAINFAPVPGKGTLVLGPGGHRVWPRGRRSSCGSGAAAQPAVRPATSPAGASSGWLPCAGIIVFGSLMGAMFVGQQYLQNVLGYATRRGRRRVPARRRVDGAGRAPLGASWSRPAALGSPC